MKNNFKRLPEWMKKNRSVPINDPVFRSCTDNKLNTVCVSARCPNISECFKKHHATFMILGNKCTRKCTFCNIESSNKFNIPDKNEPKKIALAVKELGIEYVVLTSVTRDDLNDNGSIHWFNVISSIKEINPDVSIEALIPDMNGNKEYIKKIYLSKPNCIAHNIETVERLYSKLRPEANYNRSLEVLNYISSFNDIIAKSGFMVGLSETDEEIEKLIYDLKTNGVDFLTIGQYLMPSSKHYPVYEYIKPEKFEYYKKVAKKIGIKYIESAPFVRSSYNAGKWRENRTEREI